MKTNLFLICSLLVAQPSFADEPEFQPANGGIAVGAVVVVGGGLFTFWLIKRCQRWFGDSTTNTNSPLVGLPVQHAAAYVWQDDSGCAFQPAAQDDPTNIMLEFNSNEVKLPVPYTVVDRKGFDLILSDYGLDLSVGRTDSDKITFPIADSPTIVWTEGLTRTLTVQASSDLDLWDDVMVVTIPEGATARFHLQETHRNRFYRIKTD